MMDLDVKIVIGLAAAFYNYCILDLLWYGIRSLMNKTINLAPSGRKWARVYADVLSDEFTVEEVSPEPYCFQDAHNRRTGRSRRTAPTIKAVRTYKVRYKYEGSSYETEIAGYSVKRKGAVVYCRRDNPEIAKEFIPNPAWTKEAAFAALFISGVMIFIEIMVFI